MTSHNNLKDHSFISQDISYPCECLVYHLNNGGERATLVQDLNTFMKTHFLQWLEVMSLLGLVSDAVPMLRILENQIKVSIHLLTKYGY